MTQVHLSLRSRAAAFVAILLAAPALTAFREDSGDSAAYVNRQYTRARNLEYLRVATQTFVPTDVINVVAHMERSRLDPSYRWPGEVPIDAWDAQIGTMANLRDMRDFVALDLAQVVLAYPDHPMLAPGLVRKVNKALLDFKYWYTEPTAGGKTDESYYWSENHLVIFSVVEYLMGQGFPTRVFANDGRLGAEHRATARARLLTWFEHRSRFGFAEWHSNVYYEKDITALLTLTEFAADRDLRVLAASMLDVLFFDLAVHNEKCAFGVTHGRSYKKDKMSSLDEDTWNIGKLLFDNTDYPYQGQDTGGVLLARNRAYRLPEAIRRVAVASEIHVDRERMGIAIPEVGPVDPEVVAPYGLSYIDPSLVDLWWGMNALAAWPVVPLTIQTLDAYGLWTHPQLSLLQLLEPYAESPMEAMFVTATTAPMTNLYLLNEVNTYTWRSPEVMLSSAVDYRKGFRAAQVHAWQATLDANAVVFTNHPVIPLPESTNWLDDPEDGGYWNGEATMPRSAQYRNVGIHVYAPQYPIVNEPPLDVFFYQPFTHAYFPQDRFDEVVQDSGWTLGRLGDGYVALYSYRPAEFLAYDPSRYATGGHSLPFDLVAAGGADNVWIVEVGQRSTWGSFEAFREAVVGSAVQVQPLGSSSYGMSPGYDVAYRSPSQGQLTFGWDAPLTVRGRTEPLGSYARFDNPWAQVPFDSRTVTIRYGAYGVSLDFAAKRRRVCGPMRERDCER